MDNSTDDQVQNNQDQNYQEHQVDYRNEFQSQLNQSDISGIKINVIDPVIKDGITKYIIYKVVGVDREGSFEIFRRYSDFYHLRESLITRWPGCYIPPLPPKKAVGNLDSKFIEDRRRYLEEFCQKMAQSVYLFYSDEFNLFLHNQSSDFEKTLRSLSSQTYEDLIQKYQMNFKQLSGKEINTDLVLKITGFSAFVKKVKVMFENFKEMAKNCAKHRRQFNNEFSTFTNYLMPEYEKHCLNEYTNGQDDKVVWGNTNDLQLNQFLAQIKDLSQGNNSYDYIYETLKNEAKDISAMQEALNQKAHYEHLKESCLQKQKDLQLDLQKTLAGKSTLKSIFTKGNKEEIISSLEKKIQNTAKEVDNLQFICDVITVIIGYIEIDKFKNEKQDIYYALMRKVTQMELEYHKKNQEIWNHISNNSNIMMSQLK